MDNDLITRVDNRVDNLEYRVNGWEFDKKTLLESVDSINVNMSMLHSKYLDDVEKLKNYTTENLTYQKTLEMIFSNKKSYIGAKKQYDDAFVITSLNKSNHLISQTFKIDNSGLNTKITTIIKKDNVNIVTVNITNVKEFIKFVNNLQEDNNVNRLKFSISQTKQEHKIGDMVYFYKQEGCFINDIKKNECWKYLTDEQKTKYIADKIAQNIQHGVIIGIKFNTNPSLSYSGDMCYNIGYMSGDSYCDVDVKFVGNDLNEIIKKVIHNID